MAVFVSGFVIGDFAFAICAAGNDRDCSVAAQRPTQFVGVVAFVGENIARARCASQEGWGDRYIRDVAGRQSERERASQNIGQSVDFCCVTAPRDADRLRLGPPFPPKAERWAFT